MSHFASTVKTDWAVVSDALLEHAGKVAEDARSRLASEGIEDAPIYDPDSLFGTRDSEELSLRNLPEESRKLLLKGSISPLPLHKTLVLLDSLKNNSESRCERYERLALAKALTTSISNLKFGPEVGVGPAKPDASVILPWLKAVSRIAEDLHTLRDVEDASSVVYRADSRRILGTLESDSVDTVITSPPYPNEKDYTRTTRLESVILGFLNSKEELRALKQELVRSNTRGVYKADDDDSWISEHEKIRRIADSIEARRVELGKTSGFERLYGRVTKLYFGGMARHLAELRRVLRPGAHLAYVVGDQASYLRVMIRTGQLLADIAESLGYEVVNIDLFRTRLATATREQLREEVLVLRWPGPSARPTRTAY